jgi:phospholipid/cholesterol/gamma-HCH transport system substrate-binding protein
MIKRLERKVGLFVLVGLVLAALLLIQFSKGTNLFRPTYDILLKSSDVAGLKLRAGVLMAGVQIGSVADMDLDPDGKNVTVRLRIYEAYQIHTNALFSIEQSGFLGDQYISITPTENQGPIFQDGDLTQAAPSASLQDITRLASSFVTQMQTTVQKLDLAIIDVRKHLLNENTLTNLAVTAANLRVVSEKAVSTVESMNRLVATNEPGIAMSASNLMVFSTQLTNFAAGLNTLMATNSPGVQKAVANIEESTAILKGVMADLEAGKGLAGTVLRDEKMAAEVSDIARNLQTTTANLSITSSNLNRLGLWGILWAKKQPRQPAAPPGEVLRSPKDSIRN